MADGCRPDGDPDGEPQLGVEARRALVVLSDGVSVNTRLPLEQLAREAQSAGVPIFAVVLGEPGANGKRALMSIAAATGALVVEARGASDLFEAFDAVMGFLDATYVLAYTVTGIPVADGETPAERVLRVELPGYPDFRLLHGGKASGQ